MIIVGLQGAADFLGSAAQNLDDAAELGRSGKHYAVEDMLTADDTEKYGRTGLREYYE